MLAGYNTLVSLMVISGFLPYFYIFLSAWKAGRRISASMGSIVTAIAIVCAVVPTSNVHRIWLFELKIILGTVAIIGSAWLVYQRAHRTGASVQKPSDHHPNTASTIFLGPRRGYRLGSRRAPAPGPSRNVRTRTYGHRGCAGRGDGPATRVNSR